MIVYNKFVESKKEPLNKRDIWFDGKYTYLYKEGEWKAFTLPIESVDEIKEILQRENSILESKLLEYLKISDSPFEKGSGENSAVLKGGKNISNNENEVAFGKYNKSNSNTIHSVGIGTSETNRKNAHEIMQDGKHYIYGVGGYDGTNPNKSTDLATAINNAGGGITKVTYEELVNLRNNNSLKPGMQYRIIDYYCTTAQKDTIAEGNQFDIIVTADSENVLNEVARACHHDFDIEKYGVMYLYNSDVFAEYKGIFTLFDRKYYLYESDDFQVLTDFKEPIDNIEIYSEYSYYTTPKYIKDKTSDEWLYKAEQVAFKYPPKNYFLNNNLSAWKIWYSLDNDINRFGWACNYKLPETNTVFMLVWDVYGEELYFYVRVPDYDDGDGGYAWARSNADAWNNIQLYMFEYYEDGLIDTDYLIYTHDENPSVGDYVHFEGNPYKIVSMSKGRGVIYRMIDEFNNDCPYDFKNILYRHNLGIDTEEHFHFSDSGNLYWIYTFAGWEYDSYNNTYTYNLIDGSLESPKGHISDEEKSTFYGNIIKPYIKIIEFSGHENINCLGLQYLNDIVFLGYWDIIKHDAAYNDYYYGVCCANNTFEFDCHSIMLNIACIDNYFRARSNEIILGKWCTNNEFRGVRNSIIHLDGYSSDIIVCLDGTKIKLHELAQ